MYGKTESEISINNKMSEKNNINPLEKVHIKQLMKNYFINIVQKSSCFSQRTRLEKLLFIV